MELETQTRTNDMMIAAKAFESGEATGQLIELPPQSVIAPTSSAVFAEPVIVAQPMQKNQKRNIPDFLSRMKVLAAMAGEEYRYSFPVKQKNGQKKSVEGGTIKMANDLVREYGNCMVDVRVIALVDKVGKDLIGWRNKISAGCAKHGYDLKRIEHVVAKPLNEWVAVDIARVVAELKSISDGMTTFNDLYPIDGGDAVTSLNKEFLSGEEKPTAVSVPVSGQTQASPEPIAQTTKECSDTTEAKDRHTDLPPAMELNSLMEAIERAEPEERVALFLERNGQELFEKTGSNKKTAEVLKKLGVNVITN